MIHPNFFMISVPFLRSGDLAGVREGRQRRQHIDDVLLYASCDLQPEHIQKLQVLAEFQRSSTAELTSRGEPRH
jgi:hypothetical protein